MPRAAGMDGSGPHSQHRGVLGMDVFDTASFIPPPKELFLIMAMASMRTKICWKRGRPRSALRSFPVA